MRDGVSHNNESKCIESCCLTFIPAICLSCAALPGSFLFLLMGTGGKDTESELELVSRLTELSVQLSRLLFYMGKKMPKLWVWPDQWQSMMSSEEISLLSKNYEDLVLVPVLWTGVGDPILITCARQLLRCGWDLGAKEGSWQQTRGSYSDTPVVYVPVAVLQMMYLWAGGWHGDKYVSTIPPVDFSELVSQVWYIHIHSAPLKRSVSVPKHVVAVQKGCVFQNLLRNDVLIEYNSLVLKHSFQF